MSDELPNYLRVAQDLRASLREGRYGSDGQLPTELELCETYSVSRQTVRRAFQELVQDGLVDRTPGRGTFARPSGNLYVRQMGSIEDLMALSQDTELRVIRPLESIVDVTAAARLQAGSDLVAGVAFVRSHGSSDFCVTEVRLPPLAASVLADVPELHSVGATTTATVIGLLDERMPGGIAEAQQSISVERAPAQVASDLGMDVREMLRVDRLYLDARSRPVEVATSWFVPERYTYRTRLRRTR